MMTDDELFNKPLEATQPGPTREDLKLRWQQLLIELESFEEQLQKLEYLITEDKLPEVDRLKLEIEQRLKEQDQVGIELGMIKPEAFPTDYWPLRQSYRTEAIAFYEQLVDLEHQRRTANEASRQNQLAREILKTRLWLAQAQLRFCEATESPHSPKITDLQSYIEILHGQLGEQPE